MEKRLSKSKQHEVMHKLWTLAFEMTRFDSQAR